MVPLFLSQRNSPLRIRNWERETEAANDGESRTRESDLS